MQRARDLSGGWSVDLVIGQGKLRRIEEIKNLAAELELAAFFNLEVLEYGEVSIVKRRAAQAAAGRIAEVRGKGLPWSKRRKCEGGWVVPAIEILVSRTRAPRGGTPVVTAIKTHAGIRKVVRIADQVRTRTSGAGIGWIERQVRRECLARIERNDGVQLPASSKQS